MEGLQTSNVPPTTSQQALLIMIVAVCSSAGCHQCRKFSRFFLHSFSCAVAPTTFTIWNLHRGKDNASAMATDELGFECESLGSRPPANISWFLDGQPVNGSFSKIAFDGNVSRSVLLLPASERPGNLLECRAANRNLPKNRGVLRPVRRIPLHRNYKKWWYIMTSCILANLTRHFQSCNASKNVEDAFS